jgi:peptide/nickel transport system substrate-binding protein
VLKAKLVWLLVIGAILWYFSGIGGNYAPVFSTGDREDPATTLIIMRGADAKTLDPAYAVDNESAGVLVNIYEGLVRFKEGSTEVEPCLATGWELSGQGLEWTFQLREDVYFHDGAKFNAAAVKYSIDRQLNNSEKREMYYAGFVFAPLEEVRVIDEYTIRFTLKYPYAPFLNNLAMPMAAPMVSPAAVQKHGSGFGQNPVGTGPYHFTAWKPGQEIILTANEAYWGMLPAMRKIIFRVVENEESRQFLFLDGKGDIIEPVSPAGAAFLEQKGYATQTTPALDVGYLGFFTEKQPFKDTRVRLAAAMALDRDRLIKDVLGTSCVAATGALPAPVLGSGGVNIPAHDPAAAGRLLREAGYDQGPAIRLITYQETRPYNPAGGTGLAKAIGEQLEAAGFKVTVQTYPWDDYKKAIRNREGDAFLYGWISDNGDPDNFLYTLLSANQIPSGLNASRYSNPKLDTLLLSARGIKDREIRGDVYRRAQKIVVTDNPLVFINHSLHLSVTAKDIEGYTPHPTGWTRLDKVGKKAAR